MNGIVNVRVAIYKKWQCSANMCYLSASDIQYIPCRNLQFVGPVYVLPLASFLRLTTRSSHSSLSLDNLGPGPLCACSVSRDVTEWNAGERPSIKCFSIWRINIRHETIRQIFREQCKYCNSLLLINARVHTRNIIIVVQIQVNSR